ncbi:hypothetical protein GQ53DRAFT_759191 [Thozetella sp. PMI_491]|nr:hypothetical protein GQ53DRAFT_759191 [Thozetella sp. PMI_491]
MVLPLESPEVVTIGQYGSWHLRHTPLGLDDGVKFSSPFLSQPYVPAAHSHVLQSLSAMKYQLPTAGRASEVQMPLSKPETSPGSPIRTPTPIHSTSTTHGAAASSSSNAAPPIVDIVSNQMDQTAQDGFIFVRHEDALSRRSLKRRRPDSDVDGPNTASLGCKKRRLLRHLITSRLSQPFSLPATHILNREVVANGDRRFMKLAAIMAARRLTSAVQPHGSHHHANQSSQLRRAAMINRFRLRVRNHASEKGDMDVAQLAANAALLQQSHGVGLVVGARFPTAPGSSPPGPVAQPLRMPINFKPQLLPHPLSKAAAKGQLSPPGSPAGLLPVQPTSPALRLSLSPRLRPLASPELKSTRRAGDLDDDEDDDVVSFPSSDLDGKYDLTDEHDDVYADFGVIFGGSAEGDGEDDEGDHYEEYMDDLDGIPWSAR